jgi:hypothetical protein
MTDIDVFDIPEGYINMVNATPGTMGYINAFISMYLNLFCSPMIIAHYEFTRIRMLRNQRAET